MASMAAASAEAIVWSETWPAIARGGPGRLDPYDPARSLIFDTAHDGLQSDALALFFATEIEALDWLTDYMMDAGVLDNEQEGGPRFEVEAEAEEEYEKKALTTTETDSGWDIT